MNPMLENAAANYCRFDPQINMVVNRLTGKVNTGNLQVNDPDAIMLLNLMTRYVPNNGVNYNVAMAEFNNFAMHTGPQGWDFDRDNLFRFGDVVGALAFTGPRPPIAQPMIQPMPQPMPQPMIQQIMQQQIAIGMPGQQGPQGQQGAQGPQGVPGPAGGNAINGIGNAINNIGGAIGNAINNIGGAIGNVINGLGGAPGPAVEPGALDLPPMPDVA